MDDLVHLLERKGYLPLQGQHRDAFVKDFYDKLTNDIAGDLLMTTAAAGKGEELMSSQRWGVFTLYGISRQFKDEHISFDTMLETYHDQQLLRLGSLQVMRNGQEVARYAVTEPERLPSLEELLHPSHKISKTGNRRQTVRDEAAKKSRRK